MTQSEKNIKNQIKHHFMSVQYPDLESRTEKIIHTYKLPKEVYDHDTGHIAYMCASPIEIPYRLGQVIKNVYYHLRGIEHTHEE